MQIDITPGATMSGSKQVQFKFDFGSNNYPDSIGQQKPIYPSKSTCIATYRITGNCQVSTISQFQYILKSQNPIQVIQAIHKNINQPLLYIDIKYALLQNLKQLFKGLIKKVIVFSKKYKSSNGSEMCVVYLDLREINKIEVKSDIW